MTTIFPLSAGKACIQCAKISDERRRPFHDTAGHAGYYGTQKNGRILRENEERFRLLIQNASDIITVFDQDGTIKYESEAVERMLGYTAEERIGRNISMDPIIHPDDRKIKIGLLKNAIASPKENIYGEFRLRHKNGSYRTIDAIFRNLLDDKKINGIIANYRDITERKIFEHQKDEFIGIASHELKTPVTSIKAYVQILEEILHKNEDTRVGGIIRQNEYPGGQADNAYCRPA